MEKEFLLKLAEAYQTYSTCVIEDYLAEDMHYASMWVYHEMTSKEEYLAYLVGKLEHMRKSGVRMEFELVNGRQHKNALLVTNQQAPEGNIGFVVDFNDKCKVKMLNITCQAFF